MKQNMNSTAINIQAKLKVIDDKKIFLKRFSTT